MIKRAILWSCAVAGLLVGGVFVAWLTSVDPKHNHASFEEEPLEMGLASLEDAITLAQYQNAQQEIVTILVLAYADGIVSGVDFADLGASRLDNPFDVLASIDRSELLRAAGSNQNRVNVAVDYLLPSGPNGSLHIGIGTNFPEHAEEASSDSVFNFPKFGTPTPARTRVAASPGGLLDYEVEFCMRFDRPIASIQDFDAAVKGLFLCADFTDRIALLQLADIDNLDSGSGFSDAKSGEGFFPTGPFLVIPDDWRSFIAQERMTTELNGQSRQDARGEEMTLDYRDLTVKALKDMSEPRFLYRDEYYKLSPSGQIEPDMTLMSGTSEGVIFTAPARHDYIEMVLAYISAGGPLSGKDLTEIGIPVFLKNEIESGHFLQPGDTVTYRSSRMGDIFVDVVLKFQE